MILKVTDNNINIIAAFVPDVVSIYLKKVPEMIKSLSLTVTTSTTF